MTEDEQFQFLSDFLTNEPATYIIRRRVKGGKWQEHKESFSSIRDAVQTLQYFERDNEKFEEGLEFKLIAKVEVECKLPQKMHRPWDEEASPRYEQGATPNPFDFHEIEDLTE